MHGCMHGMQASVSGQAGRGFSVSPACLFFGVTGMSLSVTPIVGWEDDQLLCAGSRCDTARTALLQEPRFTTLPSSLAQALKGISARLRAFSNRRGEPDLLMRSADVSTTRYVSYVVVFQVRMRRQGLHAAAPPCHHAHTRSNGEHPPFDQVAPVPSHVHTSCCLQVGMGCTLMTAVRRPLRACRSAHPVCRSGHQHAAARVTGCSAIQPRRACQTPSHAFTIHAPVNCSPTVRLPSQTSEMTPHSASPPPKSHSTLQRSSATTPKLQDTQFQKRHSGVPL
jgi:hypothetical protein